MKRREFIKTGLVTAGGLLIPSTAYGLENRVSGIVTDTLSGEIVEDARVLINGEEYITDSNGEYNKIPVGVGGNSWGNIKRLFNDDPKYDNLRKEAAAKKVASKTSGILRVDIKHGDYYDAVRYVNSNQSEFNIDIINKDFDMDMFNGSCRPTGVTQRWAEQPNIFIKTDLCNKKELDLVYEIINNDLITCGSVNNPHIENGIEIPEYAKYGTDGWAIVKWRDQPGFYNRVLEFGNRIYSAAVILSKYLFNRRSYLHEFSQIFGARGSIENMDFIKESGEYTQDGLNCMVVLNSRSIGSKSPDINPTPI